MRILKQLLRNEIKEKIKLLDEKYCEECNESIYEKIIRLSEYENASTIFIYAGTSTEVQTLKIIEHALENGKRVAIPKCIELGVMKACEITALSDLKVGTYGIMEPDASNILEVEATEIDIVILPCLSADRIGNRLGYGGGFYDRYLEQTSAYRVVLCRERVMCENIYTENHDKKMDAVVTERRIIHIY